MSFNVDKFMSTEYQERTEKVELKDLPADFFGPDEPKEWLVRGLTGVELEQVEQAAARATNATTLLDALTEKLGKDQVQMLKKVAGFVTDAGGDPPETVIRKYNIFALGCVEPKATVPFAVRFCRDYPVEFRTVVNQILALTGQGRMSGLTPSGDAQTSAPASPSVPGGKTKGAGKGSSLK